MRFLFLLLLVLCCSGCFPYKIAPKIKSHKVTKTKRFLKVLPLRYCFVFKDPKEAKEFYQFINIKLADDLEWRAINLPFQLSGTNFYLSLYEVERSTKLFNVWPLLIDEKLKEKGNDPLLSEYYKSRIGQWYILLTVHDNTLIDALHPQYPQRNELIYFLEALRKEYLSTNNYMDQFFRK